MPSRAAQSARREMLARQAVRRQAVTMLRVAEATAGYAAARLSNGLGPAEARRAAVEAAVELVAVAGELRRLERLCPACGKPVGTTPRPGRPRVYCSDRCRWKRGHEQAAARAFLLTGYQEADRPGSGWPVGPSNDSIAGSGGGWCRLKLGDGPSRGRRKEPPR
jgi:hypothetical protein